MEALNLIMQANPVETMIIATGLLGCLVKALG